jgi:hypothetical protein
MLAHMLDHFVFSSRQLSHRTKLISFGVCVFVIVSTFWWFKGVAFGIDGPITEHTGLLWRKVSRPLRLGRFDFADVVDAELEYLQPMKKVANKRTAVNTSNHIYNIFS